MEIDLIIPGMFNQILICIIFFLYLLSKSTFLLNLIYFNMGDIYSQVPHSMIDSSNIYTRSFSGWLVDQVI